MVKVFLVDDEIVIREGIRNSFPWEESGYTLVGEAPDGEIALPMIRDANPDILITDIRMPFMDGMQLCREVKRQMPWIGVVILSGYDDFTYARQAISLGREGISAQARDRPGAQGGARPHLRAPHRGAPRPRGTWPSCAAACTQAVSL